MEHQQARIRRLDLAIDAAILQAPATMQEVVAALQALRGDEWPAINPLPRIRGGPGGRPGNAAGSLRSAWTAYPTLPRSSANRIDSLALIA